VADAPVSQAPSLAFVIAIFGAAIVVGALIIYLGIKGMIGGPIP
jgi:hypothetical protein